MTKVIIDRTKWSRGSLAANALLVNRETAESISPGVPRAKVGRMCCLGFVCLAQGVPRKSLSGQPFPADLSRLVPGLTYRDDTWGWRNTHFAEGAAEINDNGDISEEDRESQLIELAAQNGFEFQFIN